MTKVLPATARAQVAILILEVEVLFLSITNMTKAPPATVRAQIAIIIHKSIDVLQFVQPHLKLR